MDEEKTTQKGCDSGNIIGGIIVAGIGALFLLINMDILPGLDKTWPVFIVIVGLALIIGSLFGKDSKAND